MAPGAGAGGGVVDEQRVLVHNPRVRGPGGSGGGARVTVDHSRLAQGGQGSSVCSSVGSGEGSLSLDFDLWVCEDWGSGRWDRWDGRGLEGWLDGLRLLGEVVKSPWLAWMEYLGGVERASCVS